MESWLEFLFLIQKVIHSTYVINANWWSVKALVSRGKYSLISMVTLSQMHKLILTMHVCVNGYYALPFLTPINWSIRSGNKICPKGKSKERLWLSPTAVKDIMILTGDICYNPTGSTFKNSWRKRRGFFNYRASLFVLHWELFKNDFFLNGT